MKITSLLLLAVLVLTAAAWLRPPEYDEAYSIFLTAGDPRPAWPTGTFTPGAVRHCYVGDASFSAIARNLRRGDVHPPLYFWALEIWRHFFGPGWFTARLLSVVFSLASLGILAWLAGMAEIPVIPAMLLALLSYGFAYTGIDARGFALAQCLNLLGTAAIFCAARPAQHTYKSGEPRLLPVITALAGGVALSAASFANYLAVFTGLAVLFWLMLTRPRLFAVALLGFATCLPADWYFFLAQKSSRVGQFTAFSGRHAFALLARDSGAALFGGLPLYAGRFSLAAASALSLLFAACLAAALARRNKMTILACLAAVATPLGLLALGFVFDDTPIEIRYLAFATPFIALLFANLPKSLLIAFAAAESLAILGLTFAAATMQPQGLAAAQAAALTTPASLVLVPFGNDGVGIPGPFIAAAPDDMRIQLFGPTPPDLTATSRIILATSDADDASRIANAALLAAIAANKCFAPGPATTLTRVFNRICH